MLSLTVRGQIRVLKFFILISLHYELLRRSSSRTTFVLALHLVLFNRKIYCMMNALLLTKVARTVLQSPAIHSDAALSVSKSFDDWKMHKRELLTRIFYYTISARLPSRCSCYLT